MRKLINDKYHNYHNNERHGDNSPTLRENSKYFLFYEILLNSFQAASWDLTFLT